MHLSGFLDLILRSRCFIISDSHVRSALAHVSQSLQIQDDRTDSQFHCQAVKRYKVPVILVIVLPVCFAIFWLVSTSRAATETPDYKVVRIDEKFEIRDYPALTVATTPMIDNGMDGSFGQLFRFITGKNEGAEKIEMTSPVLIDTAKDKKTMSFIMPRTTVEKGVPKPAGESVSLGKVEAARFAVLRFAGGRTAKNEKEAIEKLTAWLEGQKIAGKGDAIFAYYDPPWTPVFLRRNEVMIRIDQAMTRPAPSRGETTSGK